MGSRSFAARRGHAASLGSFRDPIPQTPCFATVFAGPWGRELPSVCEAEGVHVPNGLLKCTILRIDFESIVTSQPTATPYSLLLAVLLPSSDKRMTPPSRREALYDFKYCNRYLIDAFSFDAAGPKEKALRKENAVLRRATRPPSPLGSFLKKASPKTNCFPFSFSGGCGGACEATQKLTATLGGLETRKAAQTAILAAAPSPLQRKAPRYPFLT